MDSTVKQQEFNTSFPLSERSAQVSNKKAKQKIYKLAALTLAIICVYMFWGFPTWFGFIMKHRAMNLTAIILTGTAISLGAIIFQALVNNRIITPSVLGLDNLYMLIQTFIVYTMGAAKVSLVNQNHLFVICSLLMVVFALLLFKAMFTNESRNVFFVLLLGIVFGTLFSSATSFMATLLDPSEYLLVQDVGFASFEKPNLSVIGMAAVALGITFILIYRKSRILDVLALGRDSAITLGVNYHRSTLYFLILVSICSAISTALVGPITFLGLLTMNFTLQYLKVHNQRLLLIASVLIGITILVIGEIIVTRFLAFDSTVSIVINFFGGLYFIFLLLKEQKKW